ncbi:MAG: hypothetical protein J7L55_05735 [Desulfurococcales archaeon]|nr:hypothetical protein [Desulfurococcales archaeon]
MHGAISYIDEHEGALIKLVPAENGVMGLGYVVINSTYAGLVLRYCWGNSSVSGEVVRCADAVKRNIYLTDYLEGVFLGAVTIGGNYVPALIVGDNSTAYAPLMTLKGLYPKGFIRVDGGCEVAILRDSTLLLGKLAEEGMRIYAVAEGVKDFKVLWVGDTAWVAYLTMINGSSYIVRSGELMPVWCPTPVYVGGSAACVDSCLQTHPLGTEFSGNLTPKFEESLKPTSLHLRWFHVIPSQVNTSLRGEGVCTEQATPSEGVTAKGFLGYLTGASEVVILTTGIALIGISYVINRKLK